MDEGQVAGHRVYFAAERYLGVARDNHDALIALLRSDHGLTMFAPASLMRATFEAAFYTAWMLDPDDSRERRRRGLRVEYLDEKDHRAYYDGVMELSGHPEYVQEFAALRESLDEASVRNDNVYRCEAQELGLPFPKVPPVRVLEELGGLSLTRDVEGLSVLLRATWRGLSGQQHGRASAMLRSVDRRDAQETPGGVRAMLSVNDEAFLNALHTTTTLHIQAVTAVLERSQPKAAK